ncbi:hypothetical protein BO85DRAFT_449284 [Aspergillus piperis CBS 112811]|uniref:Uncharacterized protein n=1 Tax=Aspergillus piperis CBS 112811 TaxID=1448313 RepID=A0A8G1R176_9EURO|nr:hypothetical protein BO85DRAFT_449284 [Aspergillus piperis CBS 112811]RAH58181.1 hypothetical protein BO85DRAFT_449284 [Aspergillus piperis CBS 112811]
MSISVPVAPRRAFSPVARPPYFFVVARNRAARWKVICSTCGFIAISASPITEINVSDSWADTEKFGGSDIITLDS